MNSTAKANTSNQLHADAQTIALFYASHSQPHAPIEILSDALNLIESTAHTARVLTQAELTQINKTLTLIPNGRQRLLKQARDQVLVYLQRICAWQLPEAKTTQFSDAQHEWMVGIFQHSEHALRIQKAYQLETITQVKLRHLDNLAWTTLTLMIEVAPLPLPYWCERLNDPAPMQWINDHITISIPHPAKLSYYQEDEPESFTRYAASPMSARALHEWQSRQSVSKVSLAKLINALNQWLKQHYPEQPALAAHQWQKALQALWLHLYRMPAEILKDFSDPLRHVAPYPHSVNTLTTKQLNTLYDQPNFSGAPQPNQGSQSTRHWPHKALLKFNDARLATKPLTPDFLEQDVLPKLMFDYLDELITYGGVKKKNLTAATISRYAGPATLFLSHPLSYVAAGQQTELQKWACQVYDAAKDTESAWYTYNFLRFLTQQPLTSHLDINDFEKPTRPTKVDALALNADEVHHLVTQLLSANGTPMQRLFSAACVLLAYYGCMRRGEVLRLRLKDIRCVYDKGTHFTLKIINTDEGTTKNGQSRWVHMALPEIGAKLLRLILSFKKDADPKQPLIGFEGETLSSREHYYLGPVTKTLKALFGKRTRFHHLRHGAAHLFYLQGMVLACPEARLSNRDTPVMAYLLSQDAVKARFDYWLQGRDFAQLNNALLFDEITREIGHSHYATTRLHYLHGMEWLSPFIVPQAQTYSHAQLRYINGLPQGSNDVSRILNLLDPDYRSLPISQKKTHQPNLSHSSLNALLTKRLGLCQAADSPPIAESARNLEEHMWLTLWRHKTQQQESALSTHALVWQTQAQLHALHTGKARFTELSTLWHTLGQHQGFTLNTTQKTALSILGEMHLGEGHQVFFECPCNQKTQKALETLRALGLRFELHLTLYQNRKRLDSTKWDFAQSQLLKKEDTSDKRIISTGKTHLTITLTLPTLKLAHYHSLQAWWHKSIYSDKQG